MIAAYSPVPTPMEWTPPPRGSPAGAGEGCSAPLRSPETVRRDQIPTGLRTCIARLRSVVGQP